jgi:hypothetical protein
LARGLSSGHPLSVYWNGLESQPKGPGDLELGRDGNQMHPRFENVSVHTDVLKELRQVSFELTGKMGKRITLSETLRMLIANYRRQDSFEFLDEARNAG